MLRQKLLGPTLVAYYPEEIWRKDPFMLSEKAERCGLWGRGRGVGRGAPLQGSMLVGLWVFLLGMPFLVQKGPA